MMHYFCVIFLIQNVRPYSHYYSVNCIRNQRFYTTGSALEVVARLVFGVSTSIAKALRSARYELQFACQYTVVAALLVWTRVEELWGSRVKVLLHDHITEDFVWEQRQFPGLAWNDRGLFAAFLCASSYNVISRWWPPAVPILHPLASHVLPTQLHTSREQTKSLSRLKYFMCRTHPSDSPLPT